MTEQTQDLYRARVVSLDGWDYTSYATWPKPAARATLSVLRWLLGETCAAAELVNAATGEAEVLTA